MEPIKDRLVQLASQTIFALMPKPERIYRTLNQLLNDDDSPIKIKRARDKE